MSVVVTRVDGKPYSININGEDVKLLLRSITLVMDYAEEKGMDMWKLKNDELHKALFLIKREA